MKKILILSVLLFHAYTSNAQWHYSIEHQSVFNFGYAYSFMQHYDKQISIAAQGDGLFLDTNIVWNGQKDVVIFRTDSNQNLQTQYAIGSSKHDFTRRHALVNTMDSGYALVFCTLGRDSDITCFYPKANGTVFSSVQLFKYDKNKNLQWVHCFGDTLAYFAGAELIATKDDGFLISLGDGNCLNSGNVTPTIIKLDSMGNQQWTICMSGDKIDHLSAMAEDATGNFYAGGRLSRNGFFYSQKDTCHSDDMGIVKISPAGTILDTLLIKLQIDTNGSSYAGFLHLFPEKNGDLVACFISRNNTTIYTTPIQHFSDKDVLFLRFDSNLNLTQHKVIGGNYEIPLDDAIQLKNGNFMFACEGAATIFMNFDPVNYHVSNSITPMPDIQLIELDSNFNYIGAQSYGGSQRDLAYQLIESKDGSIWVVGLTGSNDGDVNTAFLGGGGWLLHLKDDNITSVKESKASKANFNVYPNPASNEFTISSSHYEKSNGFILLYDVLGNLVNKQKLTKTLTNVNTEQISNAVYFYTIQNESEILQRGKLVIAK